ncbi:hypothetical protein BGX27_006940 [Mortierella sp. AM989]|nr:hypothetical protein BGX27_006940 [Mortierella sp. AM989]
MSRRSREGSNSPSHQGSHNNSDQDEDEAFLTYSTPIDKRKHRQHRNDIETANNGSRSNSMERYKNNNNTHKPKRPPMHPRTASSSSTSSTSSTSSANMDGASTAMLTTTANEPLGTAVTASIIGADSQPQQQQEEPEYSKWSTIIHQVSFLLTGIFSTIAVQWLYYQGAASGTTMLTVFFNYIGMLCVGLVYAFQTWYANRWQRRQDRAHVEYDVLTADLNEMSEIHGDDNNRSIKDYIELVGKKIDSGSNNETAEIIVVHDDEHEQDEDFEEGDEEKQHLQKSKDPSSASTIDAKNVESWAGLHWPVLQVAVMDVIANALVTIGFFYVGSGMYQVIYSSIVIWCAILTRIFLGRELNGIQWVAIFGVTLGLAISAFGTVQDESPDGPTQSWLEKSFGALITLGATFLYACVYVLSDKVLATFRPKPIPEKVCSMVGGYASLLTFIYLCIHTFPNWQTEVVEVVEARQGSVIGIVLVYPLVTISSLLHSLNYYVLLSRINNIAVGIMQSLRAVLVFVMSHYLFCGTSSTQCFNEYKFVSAIVVIGCVTLFSFNSPAKPATNSGAVSKSPEQPLSRVASPIPRLSSAQ